MTSNFLSRTLTEGCRLFLIFSFSILLRHRSSLSRENLAQVLQKWSGSLLWMLAMWHTNCCDVWNFSSHATPFWSVVLQDNSRLAATFGSRPAARGRFGALAEEEEDPDFLLARGLVVVVVGGVIWCGECRGIGGNCGRGNGGVYCAVGRTMPSVRTASNGRGDMNWNKGVIW